MKQILRVEEGETGNNALLLEFGPGRVEFGGVTQVTLLPPGNYEPRGTYKPELVSQRGLQWRVLCGSKSVAESRVDVGGYRPLFLRRKWRSWEAGEDLICAPLLLATPRRFSVAAIRSS